MKSLAARTGDNSCEHNARCPFSIKFRRRAREGKPSRQEYIEHYRNSCQGGAECTRGYDFSAK